MAPNSAALLPVSIYSIENMETMEKARPFVAARFASRTREAYSSDLVYFWAWAAADQGAGESYPVGAELVVKFAVDHLAGLAPDLEAALVAAGLRRPGRHSLATVERRLAALSCFHQLLGLPNPCVSGLIRAVLAGARRKAAGTPRRKKRAATAELLEAMLSTCGEDLLGRRDRALLLFGFSSGGRRRSEIAAARVDDLERIGGAYVFTLRQSKTDQLGEGRQLPVKGRAAQALAEWLAAAGISSGPIFRRVGRAGQVGPCLSERSVWAIVRRRAELAGLPAADFGAHSLRSGFLTTAGIRGVHLAQTKELSGHRSDRVALGYFQAGEALRNPAGDLMA